MERDLLWTWKEWGMKGGGEWGINLQSEVSGHNAPPSTASTPHTHGAGLTASKGG